MVGNTLAHHLPAVCLDEMNVMSVMHLLGWRAAVTQARPRLLVPSSHNHSNQDPAMRLYKAMVFTRKPDRAGQCREESEQTTFFPCQDWPAICAPIPYGDGCCMCVLATHAQGSGTDVVGLP